MQRYKVTLAYDGTDYAGFQKQPNARTIQGEIEHALTVMTKGTPVPIVGSGRTDSGVHALGQVIHFDYPSQLSERAMRRALNSLLPDAIRVIKTEVVTQEFHARYQAERKRYLYRVETAEVLSPFAERYVHHHPYRTDAARIQAALEPLLGTHDFTSFCSQKTDKTDLVRTLYRADIERRGSELRFVFEANGFLYNMVRILVGTCLQIGDGLKPVAELERLLTVRDRTKAGPTAAACGLYLARVCYPNDAWDDEEDIWELTL